MVTTRKPGESDQDYIARLGDVLAAEQPQQHVCSVLIGTTVPPYNDPADLTVEARAAVGRPVISVPAGTPGVEKALFVVWQLDTNAPDRGHLTAPGAIVCARTAAGAFELLPAVCQHFEQHGWSPNHRS